MHISVVTDPESINSYYRSYVPMNELVRRGHVIHMNESNGLRFDDAQLLASDVVYIHRFVTPLIQQMARQLNDAGVGVVWDNDDDLAAPRPVMQRGGLNRQAMLAQRARMLQLADIVTTPSPVLAERFRAVGAKNVYVVENYVANDLPRTPKSGRDGLVIGWAAAKEHMRDRDQLKLSQTLQRLLDAHADLRAASIGVNLLLKTDRYRHTQWLEYKKLASGIAMFDVGIAPIADTLFNTARSNIKVKEYAALGIPWLASPIGPYARLGEKQGGRLVPEDRWYEELERLVADERLRRKLAKRAARWGAGETIARNIDRWEIVMHEARDRARGRGRRAAATARPVIG